MIKKESRWEAAVAKAVAQSHKDFYEIFKGQPRITHTHTHKGKKAIEQLNIFNILRTIWKEMLGKNQEQVVMKRINHG